MLLIFECVTGQMHFVAFVRCLYCAVWSFFQSPPVYCCTWPLTLLIFECVTGQMHFVAFVRCLYCAVAVVLSVPLVYCCTCYSYIPSRKSIVYLRFLSISSYCVCCNLSPSITITHWLDSLYPQPTLWIFLGFNPRPSFQPIDANNNDGINSF
jgi:hypothetical protein